MGLNRTGVKIVTALQQLAFGVSFSLADHVAGVTGGNPSVIAFSLFSAFVISLLLVGFFLYRTQVEVASTTPSPSQEARNQRRGPSGEADDVEKRGAAIAGLSGNSTSGVLASKSEGMVNSKTHLLSGSFGSQPQQQQLDFDPIRSILLNQKNPSESTALVANNVGLRKRNLQSSPMGRNQQDATNQKQLQTRQQIRSANLELPPHHAQKGAFIVFEGVDGSGKSTQLDWIHDKLCADGYQVVVTRWNSSAMLSETIKRAKRAHKLTPITFSIMQVTDLSNQRVVASC